MEADPTTLEERLAFTRENYRISASGSWKYLLAAGPGQRHSD
jgi:hypothetical protein